MIILIFSTLLQLITSIFFILLGSTVLWLEKYYKDQLKIIYYLGGGMILFGIGLFYNLFQINWS